MPQRQTPSIRSGDLVALRAQVTQEVRALADVSAQLAEARQHHSDIFRGFVPSHPGPRFDERDRLVREDDLHLSATATSAIEDAQRTVHDLEDAYHAQALRVQTAKASMDQARRATVPTIDLAPLDGLIQGLEIATALQGLLGRAPLPYRAGHQQVQALLAYLRSLRAQASPTEGVAD